ncbi:MAG TPA: DUF5615 family PIN-like protein [Candidatus Nanoarchaeia archaeon]|nr:DUF5615 family PIN-like protein [Candidatus Nanoarchaeia archaeon]
MKFLADENVDLPAVKTLKRLGVNIISIHDIGMVEYADEEILNYAKENEIAVITQDTDFLRLHAKNSENAGIIFLTKPLNTGGLIKEIQKIVMLFDNLENMIIYIPLK